MKKFILFFFALVASVCAFAQGTADFNTLTRNQSYSEEVTTASGWVCNWAACLAGQAEDAEDDSSTGKFHLFGTNPDVVTAVCINGRTDRVGKITSPVLEGGCGTLSFDYAYIFSEKNGVNINIAIVQGDQTVASYDLVDTELAKGVAATWSQKVAVPGDFQIVITSNCPTQLTKNGDRTAIWNLSWTAQAPLPESPLVFSDVVDGGVYAIVNVQPLDPVKFYVLESVDGELTAQSADKLDGNTKYAETAQYKAIELEDGRFAFQNVATGDYLAWRNNKGNGGNGNCGFNPEINEMTSWTMNDGTVFADYRTYWFYVNARNENGGGAGSLIIGNAGNWDGWGSTECKGRTDFSNNYGFVACATEVDFTKVNVASVAEEASESIDPAKWYLVKQHRGGVSPIYDKDGSVFRAGSDDIVAAGVDAADVVNYLVRFVPAGEEDVYNIQFANGRYFADGTGASNSTPVTTTEEEPGLFNVKYILDTPGHFGIYAYDMGAVIDNNGKGNSVVYWGSGEISDKVDGNNDFKIYEVEFAPKTTAAADLKELIKEVEAAYAANNVVVEVGEGIITSTDQFYSEYTDEEEGSLENLLDGDGSTFWHSTWHHGNDTPMHVHYLQVEFAEPISGDFELNMNRRVNNGGMCQNDNPVKMSVETSVDGVEFVLADEFDTPFTQTGANPLVQAVFNIPTAAKYLRFFAEECNGGNNRGYWHCGDFQIKPVVTPAPNAAHAEAAAAFAEALAAAKEVGANATDADVAALQAAYDAYVAALNAPVVDDKYVLNFDKDLVQMSDDRHVTGFKLNDQVVEFPAYNTVYLDATDMVMEVNAGEELQPAIIWDGAWMHGLVYVDLDNDGSFYEEGDLVAHSPYTGNQNLATTISAFTAPAKAGEYRMRVKTDWVGDSQTMDGGGLDPAGRIGEDGTMEGNNSIWKNRGRIIDLVLKVVAAEPETFPMEGVAYKFKNVDSQLYVKVIDDAEQCVTLGENPDEMFFTAVEGGWTISNSKGYQLGSTAKGWNIGNTATPIVWTIEEVEGGYAFKNEKGYLGYDNAAAGQKAFRDKNYSTHHGIFNIWKYDEEEIIVEPEKTLEETWENIHNLLAEAEAIQELNQVELTYDSDGYFEDFTSPIVGKVGYKKHDVVWALCDGTDYVSAFTSWFSSAAEAEEYMADWGGIAALEEILQNVIDDYNAAEVVLPTPGKTYVIRNHANTYGDEFSYAYYYNGEKLALSECANATTAEYMWTISEPVKYSYFDADLNVIEETRYQFNNAADNSLYMSWRGAGSDSYAGVTTNASDANSKWYITGKKVDGTAAPVYGTLAIRTNADGNQYRTAVVDMRKSTDHLSKSNGDHFDATYSSWFIFEEVEIPVLEWDGSEPVVTVEDATNVKVTFTDASSVEATNFGVLAAVYDEQGDVYAIAFNSLFDDTVEYGKDCATIHFKKISDIRAELAESAKAAAAKISAAVGGADIKGKVVIAGKSFKIDGEKIYNEIIVADILENGGNVTGIEGISFDKNAKVYDLQGRRIAAPRKGLQISNGVKVVR